MSQSRRSFLARSSAAAIGVMGARLVPGAWPAGQASEAPRAKHAVYDEADLRALAQRALDAARSAGAKFADVRVVLGRHLSMDFLKGQPRGVLESNLATIGLRAIVDATWGFAGTTKLSPDGVARMARLAVARSRDGQPRHARRMELTPTPVVPDGRWQTPIGIDPFTIPVRDQVGTMVDIMAPVLEVKGVDDFGAGIDWIRKDVCFASTEGSQILQRLYWAGADIGVSARSASDEFFWIQKEVKGFRNGAYGYEALSAAELKVNWLDAAKEVVRLAAVPAKSVDVGRYDVVLSPQIMADITYKTVGCALELDRALGDRANTDGTSYAMPPLDIVGRFQLASPRVTITADRSRPHATATAGWDEEGVKPEDFTLVEEGRVIDYVTTRDTAATLAAYDTQRGRPVRSHGCATNTGYLQPALQCPNMTLQPGPGNTTLDDLIRDVRDGFYVVAGGGGSVDQQCLNVQTHGTHVFEIKQGKLGRLVKDMAMQFSAPSFWKNVVALGGAASASLEDQLAGRGLPTPDLHDVIAVGMQVVPARLRQINVVNVGKQA